MKVSSSNLIHKVLLGHFWKLFTGNVVAKKWRYDDTTGNSVEQSKKAGSQEEAGGLFKDKSRKETDSEPWEEVCFIISC